MEQSADELDMPITKNSRRRNRMSNARGTPCMPDANTDNPEDLTELTPRPKETKTGTDPATES